MEVEKILQEITHDIFAKATDAPISKLPVSAQPTATTAAAEPEQEETVDDEEVRAMQSRLQSL